MLLTLLSLFLSASASVLAQTQIVYDSAHNTTSIGGTWSSGSRNVTTGPTYVQPNTRSFSFPTNTGVSYSFDESTGWFEVLRYRMTGNGASPKCITVVLNWAHGKFTLQPNGSITLYPLADGFQRIQQPCAANSDFTETYQDQELYQSWQIFTDPVDGAKLHMFGFDGSPVSPQYQISTTPAMLPLQLLYNATSVNATTIIQRRSNDAAPSPIHRWNFATAVTTVTAILGGALLI